MRKDRYDTLLKLNKSDAYKYKFMCKIAIPLRIASIIFLLPILIITNGILIFREFDRNAFNKVLWLDCDAYFFWIGNWYWNKYLAPKYFNKWKHHLEMKEEYKEILSKIK